MSEICTNDLLSTTPCICRDCQIDRLKRELEKAKESLAKQIDSKDKCCKALQVQLCETKKEIQGLGEIIIDYKRQLARYKNGVEVEEEIWWD